jgi:hypothetical protein
LKDPAIRIRVFQFSQNQGRSRSIVLVLVVVLVLENGPPTVEDENEHDEGARRSLGKEDVMDG